MAGVKAIFSFFLILPFLKGDAEGFVLFFVSHQFVLTIAHKLARVMQHIQFFCDFYVLTSNRGKNMASARVIFSLKSENI
jgi:hypothetical protein